jgi:hypothetical protein
MITSLPNAATNVLQVSLFKDGSRDAPSGLGIHAVLQDRDPPSRIHPLDIGNGRPAAA